MDFLEMKNSRDFLKAALKNSSIRKLSRKLGYNSDRGVGMVLKGQRAMSAEMQARLSRLLKLTAKEQLHLQYVLRKERDPAQTPEAPPPRYENTQLESERLHPLVPDYALAVLEILRVHPAPLTTARLHACLRQKISRRKLETTLNAMAEQDLIKREGSGLFRALKEDEYVTTSQDIPSRVIRAIHRAQLERAIETLEEQSVTEREFIAKTLLVSKDRLPEIKRRLREALDEIADEIVQVDAQPDSIVAQLNLQFYLQSDSLPDTSAAEAKRVKDRSDS